MRISDWSSDVCSSDLSADLPCRKDAQRQKHKEDDGCEDEQELGDSCGRARNAAEPQKSGNHCDRSEERRVGKSVSVRVDLGGRRIIKNKKTNVRKHKSKTT